MALSLAWLSIPLAMSGNLIEAVELAESSLSLARAIASWPSQAVATAALCNILPMAGQSERAIELGEEGVGISEERGELWARGYMLGATSQVHWRQGDRQLAEVQARAGAATKHVIDDRSGLQLLLETLAWMAAEGGVHARAAMHPRFGRARAQGQRARDPGCTATATRAFDRSCARRPRTAGL